MEATEKLRPSLERHQLGTSWRIKPQLFHSGPDLKFPAGLATFAAGWFEKVPDVSGLSCKELLFGSLFQPWSPCNRRTSA
jgi:hypothetical protein